MEVARKAFRSDRLTRLVQYLLLGAPNPYSWNEHAVKCAVLRRQILAPLVGSWFGDKLRVAEVLGYAWDPERRSFHLDTEFVEGGPPMLHHPMNRRGAEEIDDLVNHVMAPLQDLLEESGFDGLVWQAGRGNPVALGNFLRVAGTDRRSRWVWIDLESGVPALFPWSPRALLCFYLPRAWHWRRPLFDDVNVERLQEYLQVHRARLREQLGADGLERLHARARELEFHQQEWKQLPLHQRGIRYQEAKERLTPEQARHYLLRPMRWYLRELYRVPAKTVLLAGAALAWITAKIGRLPLRRGAVAAVRFLGSQRYRTQVARAFVARRIASWEERGQLVPEEARALRAKLHEETTEYLTDFGVHVAIKPFVKAVEYLGFGAFLYGAGIIDEGALTAAVLLGGCAARTLYTLGRVLQATLKGRERPWIALGVGTVPIVGNLAYPLQIVYSGAGEKDVLAQFLLYDGCSAIGRKLPIWGGRDTLAEHAFNHLPDRIVPGRNG